jgi:hypothetical protein
MEKEFRKIEFRLKWKNTMRIEAGQSDPKSSPRTETISTPTITASLKCHNGDCPPGFPHPIRKIHGESEDE